MMGNTENLSDGEIDFKWTLSHSSDRLTESFKHHRMAMFRYFTMKFIIDNIKNENKFDDKLPSDPSRGLFLNVKPEKKRARSLVYRLHHFFMQWPMQCKGIYQSLWRYMRNDERILCIQIIRVRYAVATSLNWLMFYSLFLYSLLIVVTDEEKNQ